MVRKTCKGVPLILDIGSACNAPPTHLQRNLSLGARREYRCSEWQMNLDQKFYGTKENGR